VLDGKNKSVEDEEFCKNTCYSVKIHVRILRREHWPPIMLSNKCAKFQPVPFSSFRDTSLRDKILQKCDKDTCENTKALLIL
jgi:hypothetical protein